MVLVYAFLFNLSLLSSIFEYPVNFFFCGKFITIYDSMKHAVFQTFLLCVLSVVYTYGY